MRQDDLTEIVALEWGRLRTRARARAHRRAQCPRSPPIAQCKLRRVIAIALGEPELLPSRFLVGSTRHVAGGGGPGVFGTARELQLRLRQLRPRAHGRRLAPFFNQRGQLQRKLAIARRGLARALDLGPKDLRHAVAMG